MMKLEANIEAVILWQSAQLQTKEPTRPGPEVGCEEVLEWWRLMDSGGDKLTKASWTAPQKHVAVASSSVDQPSVATPARGKSFLFVAALEVAIAMVFVWKDFFRV